jgi:hypothetical protein
VTEGELDHLTNLSHLLTAATDIVVADTIELFLILSLNGLSLVEKHGVGRDNAVFAGVNLDHLELNSLEATAYKEGISLTNGTVAVLEVGDEIGLSEVSGNSLDGIIDR